MSTMLSHRLLTGVKFGPALLAVTLALAGLSCVGRHGAPARTAAAPAEPAREPSRLLAPSPTPTPPGDHSTPVIDGLTVVPLQTADPIDIPDGVALLVETGCYQCDGPITGLARVYRDTAGRVRSETLFGRPMASAGEASVGSPVISGFALSADASTIVASVCAPPCTGIGGPAGAGVRTTLVRSLDGGVNWADLGVLDGPYSVAAILSDGAVLVYSNVPSEQVGQPPGLRFQRFPSGEPVEPPPGATKYGGWVTLHGSELLWRADDGHRLLRSDGSQFLALPPGSDPQLASVSQARDGEELALSWVDEHQRGTARDPTWYLGIAGPDGGFSRVYSAARLAQLVVGGWLDSGTLAGNADSPDAPSRLITLIDLSSGQVHPILQPFGDPAFPGGRNAVLGVTRVTAAP